MRRLTAVYVLLAVLVAATSACQAQGWFDTTTPKPNTIKAGIFYPIDSDVRDATDDIWFHLAYERVIYEVPQSNSDVTLEIGWMEGSGTIEDGGTNGESVPTQFDDAVGDVELRIIPITVNWRQHSAASGLGGSNMYYGLGVGAYLCDASGAVSDDSTEFGLNGFVGLSNGDWNYELKYHWVEFEDENVGGLIGSIGYRF